jgi:hypothetical protein
MKFMRHKLSLLAVLTAFSFNAVSYGAGIGSTLAPATVVAGAAAAAANAVGLELPVAASAAAGSAVSVAGGAARAGLAIKAARPVVHRVLQRSNSMPSLALDVFTRATSSPNTAATLLQSANYIDLLRAETAHLSAQVAAQTAVQQGIAAAAGQKLTVFGHVRGSLPTAFTALSIAATLYSFWRNYQTNPLQERALRLANLENEAEQVARELKGLARDNAQVDENLAAATAKLNWLKGMSAGPSRDELVQEAEAQVAAHTILKANNKNLMKELLATDHKRRVQLAALAGNHPAS